MTIPILCRNLKTIFEDKLPIFQEYLCYVLRSISLWYVACSEAIGQQSEALYEIR